MSSKPKPYIPTWKDTPQKFRSRMKRLATQTQAKKAAEVPKKNGG